MAVAGTTFTRFGWRSTLPTVHTWLPPNSVARRRRNTVISAATYAGSRRSRIGVVPAWLLCPVIVTSCQEMPCTPVTAPIVYPSPPAPAPARRAVRRRRAGRRRGQGQRTRVADPLQFVAETLTVDRDGVQGLLEREAADVNEGAEHVGLEAGALLVGEERDAERSPGTRPARWNVSITSSPASTPRLPSYRPPVRTVSMCEPVVTGAPLADLPGAEHVADAVDLHTEAEIAHPRHDEVAAVAVGVGERQPAGAAAVDRTDLGERGDAVEQAGAVDRRNSITVGHEGRD